MATRQATVYNTDMSIDLSPEQRNAVAHSGSTPIQVIDPQTQVTYVLLRADVYEPVRKVLDDPFDIREAYPLMDAAARAAGWDDAAEDLYGPGRIPNRFSPSGKVTP